jgi:Protein of unknown function (DUF2855)
MSEFQIRKDNFLSHRIVETPSSQDPMAIKDGEVLLKIDSFAFTANNITYAVLGEKLGYWQFFPPSDDEAALWGIIPVWGFADVITSKAPEVPVGERLFGYFPPAHYTTMCPTRVTELRLFDGSAHRAALPPGYNSYSRVNAEPGYQHDMDNLRMLLWPLHITSFCIWDSLKDRQWLDAKQIIILSASSKTSIGLAYALSIDDTAPHSIAITSAQHCDFVNQLDLYDQTLSYDAIANIDNTIPTVIVDMSGNGEVLAQLHAHLADNMKRCLNVGITHWDEIKPPTGVITERSEFFFAPGHIQKRMKEWGPDEFTAKTTTFMRGAARKSLSILKFMQLDGLDGLAAVYTDVCEGSVAPDQGLIVKM